MPTVTRDRISTAWVLFRIYQGEPEVLGVYSSVANAELQAARIMAYRGKRLPWVPLPGGGALLIRETPTKRYMFRAEPWVLDAEVT